MNRRRFLAASAVTAVTAATFAVPGIAWARARSCRHDGGHRAGTPKHPDPRPGITADAVLPDDEVSASSKEAYAAAREFPAVLDGLYCHCDCAERDGLRSLLSCFESKMPQSCRVCRGEAEMAGRLARDGKSLAEIRKAIDERYG